MDDVEEDKYPQTFYKVTCIVVDLNGELGKPAAVQHMMENTRWGVTHVIGIESRIVPDYHDDHPLNKTNTFHDEVEKLFTIPPQEPSNA